MENDIKLLEMKIGKWDALVLHDVEHSRYTVSYKGEGGAIISNENLDKSMETFIEAMGVAESVMKLMEFVDTSKLPHNNNKDTDG